MSQALKEAPVTDPPAKPVWTRAALPTGAWSAPVPCATQPGADATPASHRWYCQSLPSAPSGARQEPPTQHTQD